MKTAGTLFTGGGGVDIALQQAGYEVLFGLEYDPEIAEVANLNLGNHVRVADILNADPNDYPKVDLLHASPPCPSFSVAKANGKETERDIAMANKVAEFIRVLQPKYFTLENVRGYKKSESLKIILEALGELGYLYDIQIVNAADFGVPQTRVRLILRASHDFLPQLPEKEKWIGWYQAVEDLIPTLPESKFAPWQLKRLPKEFKEEFISKAFLIGGANTSDTQAAPGVGVSDVEEPTRNVATNAASWKAFIQPGGNKWVSPQEQDSPIYTVSSSIALHPNRAIIEGKVVKMTTRALARFQTFPDSYILPDSQSLACKIIGNAVPVLMMRKIVELFD